MTLKPLFTVVITSYNHGKTIYDSIESVLLQNYSSVELVITDDGSNDFDVKAVQNYIDKNKHVNLKNCIICAHKQNSGTTKSLNSAFSKARGYYVTAFSGDDCLHDENTLSNYEKAFNENHERNIVTAQCHRYDAGLNEFLFKQVNINTAYYINEAPSQIQYKILSEANIFAMGATAFKKETLEKYNFFDERYKLVEDWPLFLKLTRNGEKFYFVDFVALKHRAGGVSKRKSKENNLTLSSKEFCVDLLAVIENEIFPYMRGFSYDEQLERITRYRNLIAFNKDILSGTNYDGNLKVKMELLFRYPLIAVKLFLKNRLK